MSATPYVCETCGVTCVYERAARLPGETSEATYGVSWLCPRCNERALDVCPTGPIVPSKTSCLNCGGAMQPACALCGMSQGETGMFFELERVSADPVADAIEDAGKGLFRRALALLNLALLRDPANPRTWEEKGKIYQTVGLHHAAALSFEQALANGEEPLVRIALGCALYDLGRHRQAIEVYDILLERVPDSEWTAIALANQANSLVALGEYAQAEVGFQKAIQLEPREPNHYYNYALCLSTQGRGDRALHIIDEGLRRADSRHRDAALLAERARILEELARAEAAPAEVEKDERAVPAAEARRPWYRFWEK
jgi:tetratricopeptide (TPR) repeat protein